MKKNLIISAVITTFSVVFINVFAQVGINTPTPSASLDVISQGNTATTKALEINNSSGTEMLTVLDQGNIGIGVANPQRKLDINSNNEPLRTQNLLSTDRTYNTDGTMKYLAYDTSNGDVTQKIHRYSESVSLAQNASATITDPSSGINGLFHIRCALNSTAAGANIMATFNFARKGFAVMGVAIDGAAATATRAVAGSDVTYTITSGSITFRVTKLAANQITITNLSGATRTFFIIIEPIL